MSTAATTPKSRPARPASWRDAFTMRRLVISLVLAAAVFILIVGFTSSVDQKPKVSLRPKEVLSVQPGEGDPVTLRQTPISAQLDTAFTGRLRVDGRDIPIDQIDGPVVGVNASAPAKGTAGLNVFTFAPAAGKEITRLAPGRHSATVIFWPISLQEGAVGTGSYIWYFNVS